MHQGTPQPGHWLQQGVGLRSALPLCALKTTRKKKSEYILLCIFSFPREEEEPSAVAQRQEVRGACTGASSRLLPQQVAPTASCQDTLKPISLLSSGETPERGHDTDGEIPESPGVPFRCHLPEFHPLCPLVAWSQDPRQA